MSYRALYRVWRPQRFDELVGQHVIATTLENTIKMHHVSHAYLFTGPRGTGKTSTAKIFSKAVNCPHSVDGEPCNKCPICKAVTNGTLNDVIEIDAASNNGVDEIRNVRDKAHYAPTQAKYKIYIIDEVHMLSEGAFNALLKTLEEPPKNVIFILATTDLEKVPATIVSRTQHFTFKRIHPKDIVNRMKYILKHEHITYDIRALDVIAEVANGGMRDALSILDEALSYGDDHVSYNTAMQVTGRVASNLMLKYIKNIASHNTVDALSEVHKLLDIGKSASQFEAELISYCQTFLMYKQSPNLVKNSAVGLLTNSFKNVSDQLSNQQLCTMIKDINGIDKQMQYTSYPNVCLEALTVELSTIKPQQSLDGVYTKIKHMERELQILKSQPRTPVAKQPATTNSNSTATVSKPVHKSRPVSISGNLNTILSHATRQNLDSMKTLWRGVVSALPADQHDEMKYTHPVACSPDGVVISFKYPVFCNVVKKNKQHLKSLEDTLSRAIGHDMQLILMPYTKWLNIRNSFYSRQ